MESGILLLLPNERSRGIAFNLVRGLSEFNGLTAELFDRRRPKRGLPVFIIDGEADGRDAMAFDDRVAILAKRHLEAFEGEAGGRLAKALAHRDIFLEDLFEMDELGILGFGLRLGLLELRDELLRDLCDGRRALIIVEAMRIEGGDAGRTGDGGRRRVGARLRRERCGRSLGRRRRRGRRRKGILLGRSSSRGSRRRSRRSRRSGRRCGGNRGAKRVVPGSRRGLLSRRGLKSAPQLFNLIRAEGLT